jgi:hypothetical protein
VIDWPHASRGAKASDVALTWTSLACFEHDATGLKAVVADRFRALSLDRFLAAAGRHDEDVPSSVELRRRSGERQAALTSSVCTTGPTGSGISRCSAVRSVVRCR